MNMNALFGIIGLSLLAFVAAFAIGRLNRTAPALTLQPTSQVVSASQSQPTPPTTTQDAVTDEAMTQNASTNSFNTEAPAEAATNEAAPVLPPTPTKPSSADAAAATPRAAENRKAMAARRAHADQLPADFARYYAQELPEDAISTELRVRVRVSGEQAEVITLSSPAFNSENKDFVLQQVRSELAELGFKQVSITNGRGFTTRVRF